MTLELLGLGDESNALQEKLQDWLGKIEDLKEPVGQEPHKLPWSPLDETFSDSFELLGKPASTFVHLSADAWITGMGDAAKVALFSDSNPIMLNKACNLAIFDAKIGLGSDLSGSQELGATGSIKFQGSLNGEVRYRHFLPVRKDLRRATAYKNAVFGSRLPNLVDLGKKLGNGEAHRLDAKLTADLGLDLEAGYSFADSTALQLTEGLAPSFAVEMRASVLASIGLGFSSRMALVVAEAGQRNDGWTRVRLQRERASRLSFGLTMGLDLKYDLGTSLVQLFEDALDDVPTPRLVRASREMLGYAQDPELLKEKLVGETAEVLDDLVQEHILQPLSQEGAVQDAIGFAKEVVDFYDGLEGQVQGLWDRLLSKVDLDPGSAQGQKVRGWLTRITDLETQGLPIDDFLNGDQKELVDALEALSGKSLEELLLTDGLQGAIKDAAELATKAQNLLDNTDDAILAKIRDFNEKTGITDVVEKLRGISSLEELQTEARQRVQRAAEKLVGKALDRISQEDLDRIKAWAEKTDRLLSFADPDDPNSEFNKLAAKIKGFLQEAKVDYGLSVSWELERVARSSALIDFEIDPDADQDLLRPLAKALGTGDVRGMLSALLDFETQKDGDESPSLPFLLRECVFTSEKIRTTGFSSIFTMVGLGQNLNAKQGGRTQSVEQTRIELQPNVEQRVGTYTSGLVRFDTTAQTAASAAVWLVVEDRGPLSLSAAYNGKRDAYFRLVFSFEAGSTKPAELEALRDILNEFGFNTSGKELPEDLATGGAAARFAMELRVPVLKPDGDLLAEITSAADSKGGELDGVFLDAAERWLEERFVVNPPTLNGQSNGRILARLVADDWFKENGRSAGALNGAPDKPGSVKIGRQTIAIRFNPPDLLGAKLIGLAKQRGELSKEMRAIGRGWATAKDDRTDKEYEDLSEIFGSTMRGVWTRGTWWRNPMFGVWFWFKAIQTLAPDKVAGIKGFASCRGLGQDGEADDPETWESEIYLRS